VALDAGGAEALGPADELAVVDAPLLARVREREAEREVVGVLVAAEVVADERVEALGAEVEAGVRNDDGTGSQLLAVLLLLLLGEAVLGLRDLKLALALEGDEADAEVGATEIDGEELARLLPSRPSEHVGRD
jgi:hypothetical protein